MYAASTGRPEHPSPEGARPSCADRVLASWPLPPSGAATLAIQRGQHQVQPCSQPMMVVARGDRHIGRSRGSYEVQVHAAFPWRCVGSWLAPGGFACPLDDRVPPSRPKTVSRPGREPPTTPRDGGPRCSTPTGPGPPDRPADPRPRRLLPGRAGHRRMGRGRPGRPPAQALRAWGRQPPRRLGRLATRSRRSCR
jgi:hypothetical protein